MFSDVMGRGGGARVLLGTLQRTSNKDQCFLWLLLCIMMCWEGGYGSLYIVENKNRFLVIFSMYPVVTGRGAGGMFL